MIEPRALWIILTFLLLLVCVFGQRRADGLGFIPRTAQNAKRVQERFSAIQRIKSNMEQMGITNIRANGMPANNMGSSGMKNGAMMSGSMSSSGMGSNGMGSSGMGSGGMGNSGQGMSQGAFSYNVPSQMNNGGMMSRYMHPEQMEAMADLGGIGMMRNGMTIINVEAMGNGAMGMMYGGGMRNNGRTGRNGRRNRMKIPLCQPLHECAERFIPPQCKSWRFDSVNNIMCRKCPINRCEGGAAEYFNTMYEYHPSRLMMNMVS